MNGREATVGRTTAAAAGRNGLFGLGPGDVGAGRGVVNLKVGQDLAGAGAGGVVPVTAVTAAVGGAQPLYVVSGRLPRRMSRFRAQDLVRIRWKLSDLSYC